MNLSRDKFVNNNLENRDKLARKVLESMNSDEMRQSALKVSSISYLSAYKGIVSLYLEEDQCFIDDYYKIFPEEDPELNGVQEEEEDKIIYYHGHHSNPCVVGEIHKHTTVQKSDGSMYKGIEVIMITHDIICEGYDDNLNDITKVWDSQTKSEVCNKRYDTDPDTCVHIPVNTGKHANLSNQVLEQILLNNNVEFVSFDGKGDLIINKTISWKTMSWKTI